MGLVFQPYPYFPSREWKGHRKSAPNVKLRVYDDNVFDTTVAWIGYRLGAAGNRFGIPRDLHSDLTRILGRAPRYAVISGYLSRKDENGQDLTDRILVEKSLIDNIFEKDIADVAVHSTLCAVTEGLQHVIKGHLKDPAAWLLPPGSPNFNILLREISAICFEMEALIQVCVGDPHKLSTWTDVINQGEVSLRNLLKDYDSKDIKTLIASTHANTFDIKDLKFINSSNARGCITVVRFNNSSLPEFIPSKGRKLGDGKSPNLNQLLRYTPSNSVMTVPEAKVFYDTIRSL